MADSLFHYTREPDPQWVRDLAAVSPRSEQVSWLSIVWEAGTPEEPGQRWVLYEMTPRAFIHPDLLAELQGPDPRTVNTAAAVYTLITRVQWGLFRETQCLGRAFWIIQGDKGGHKKRFTQQEQQMLSLMGKPTDPPTIGDLPYAPFDQRVIWQVVRFDKLWKIGERLGAFRRQQSTAGHRQQQMDAQRQFREELVKWLADQVMDPAEDFVAAARNGELTGPPTDTDWQRVEEEATERFITTGTV